MFQIINVPNVVMNNNYQECPYCGTMMRLEDGVFSFDEDGIATLLSDPEFTTDKLLQLHELALAAQRRKYSAEKFKEEAEKITPKAGLLALHTPKTFADMMAFYSFLSVLIFGIITAYQNSKDNSSTPIVNNYTTINKFETPTPKPQTEQQAKKKKTKPERKEGGLSQREAIRKSKKFKSGNN